jgi:hypothetical protein
MMMEMAAVMLTMTHMSDDKITKTSVYGMQVTYQPAAPLLCQVPRLDDVHPFY